jgi:hypothetical protein
MKSVISLSLEILSLIMMKAPYTLLTSRRDGLISIYDLSASGKGPLHQNTRPYCLPFSISQENGATTGTAIFYHSPARDTRDVTLFSLSEQGGICRMELFLSQAGNEHLPQLSKWTELAAPTKWQESSKQAVPFEAKDMVIKDLHPIYNRELIRAIC